MVVILSVEVLAAAQVGLDHQVVVVVVVALLC
jgi:hypothetical protein